MPVAVGVGEPGRGPTYPRPRLHSARDAQVAPGSLACCKAKETQCSADVMPRTQNTSLYIKKAFLIFCPPPDRATNKTEVSGISCSKPEIPGLGHPLHPLFGPQLEGDREDRAMGSGGGGVEVNRYKSFSFFFLRCLWER